MQRSATVSWISSNEQLLLFRHSTSNALYRAACLFLNMYFSLSTNQNRQPQALNAAWCWLLLTALRRVEEKNIISDFQPCKNNEMHVLKCLGFFIVSVTDIIMRYTCKCQISKSKNLVTFSAGSFFLSIITSNISSFMYCNTPWVTQTESELVLQGRREALGHITDQIKRNLILYGLQILT